MKSLIFSGACALALGACASTSTQLPDTTALQAAALPGAATHLHIADQLAGYTYRAPTGPRDWREVNQEQAEGN